MSSILLFVPLSVPFGPKGLKRKLVETSNLWGYILLAPVTDPCRGEGPVVQVTRILIGAPKKTTDKLQRVLNSAARIVSNTRKFDGGLTHFRRSQLHWLDVVDRVRFRVCVQVFRCLHKMAPEYLSSVDLLPTRLRHFWSSPPAIGWPWSSQLSTCETCFVRRTFICIRRPFKLELTSCSP